MPKKGKRKPKRDRSLTNGVKRDKPRKGGKSQLKHKHSLINGDGLINGQSMTNGNGLTNGNGMTNGKGLVNGRGLVNGTALTNGNGMTNGTSQGPSSSMTARRRKGKIRITVLAVVAAIVMVTLPLMSMFIEEPTEPIEIDGKFGDWQDRMGTDDPMNDVDPVQHPELDLLKVRLHRWGKRLAFQLETGANPMKGDVDDGNMNTVIILLDTDGSAGTGYETDGIGADRKIEVHGFDGRVRAVTLYEFDDSRSVHDWNGWRQSSSGTAMAASNGLEGYVNMELERDPVAAIHLFGMEGCNDKLDTPASTLPLTHLILTPWAPMTSQADDTVILGGVRVTTLDEVPLEGLKVKYGSTGIDLTEVRIRLRLDNGNRAPSEADTVIGASVGSQPEAVTISSPLSLVPGRGYDLWLEAVMPDPIDTYGTLGVLEVEPILLAGSNPIITETGSPVPGKETKTTIGSPDRIEIDGAFADWKALSNKVRTTTDPSGDVTDGPAPDVDILQTFNKLNKDYLYISTLVSGTNLGGTAIPFEPRPIPGPPVPPDPNRPQPPEPPEPEPVVGNDRTEVFIEVGNGNGYQPSWSPIKAHYMVAIEGRDGQVLSSKLYSFAGTGPGQWSWKEEGTMSAMVGGAHLEAAVPRDILSNLKNEYKLFFRTTDWTDTHEDLAGPDVRMLVQFAFASFDPTEGLPELPPAYTLDKASGYFVVQLHQPVSNDVQTKIEGCGASILDDFISTNSMVIWLPTNDPSAIIDLEEVRWVGFHQPAYRVDPLLMELEGETSIRISTYKGTAEIIMTLESLGSTIDDISANVIDVTTDISNLREIATIPDVQFIELKGSAEIHNDIARGITWANPPLETFGLTGLGQIIAIADSGLDTGNDTDNQPDNLDTNGRVIKWFDLAYDYDSDLCDDGDCTDDNNGHGTHVAGTAVGSGYESSGQLRGVAPETDIVFMGMGDDDGSNYVYPPSDLREMYGPAFDEGAKVHQNSWGVTDSDYYGDYISYSYHSDHFMWHNQSMLIVYSAGNSGPGDNTTTPPATAKNMLTVGGNENYRPDLHSYGDDPTDMYQNSARGYTTDGRIKPDIIAPATWVLSSRSSLAVSGGWGLWSIKYLYMGGTSMAAPHASGAAILVRQYFTDYEEISPSASLIKAVLINGADDMDVADIPNKNEGWGRLNLTNSLFPEKPRVMRYVDNATGFSSSSDDEYVINYTVGQSQVPLKITLVWTDFPGSTVANQAAPKLINDLNLEVTDPDGDVYKGNEFSSGWSTTGGSADYLNNVECVYIDEPTNGSYSISVDPHTISESNQNFSIVISGELVPDLNVTEIEVDPVSPVAGDDVWLNATIANNGTENLPPMFKDVFSSLTPGVSEEINDVAFSPRGDFALLVGTNRTILKYDTEDGTLSTLNTNTVPWTDFQAVAFNPMNHSGNVSRPEALLVGTNGTIVDYDGYKFHNVTGTGGSDVLTGVAWNSNGTQAVIVGENGKVYSFPNITVVFGDDFEDGDGEWTFLVGTSWANVTTQYASYDHSMHIQYSAGDADNFRHKNSQVVNGTDLRSAYAEYMHRFQIPMPANGANRGHLHVYARSDEDDSYTLIARYEPYTGDLNDWNLQHIDLIGYYPSDEVALLFHATCDANPAKKGDWWIDDIYINKTIYKVDSVTSPDSTADLQGVDFVNGWDKALIVANDSVTWTFDSGTVSNLTNSGSNDLRAVSFQSGSDQALVVGDSGTVLRYDSSDDSFSTLAFPGATVSLWDVQYRQDHSTTGPKPESSQAILVGEGGEAWQYLTYDGHFNKLTTGTSKDLYGVDYSNFNWPLYGPGLAVGHGSDPVVLENEPELTGRSFNVSFYKDDESWTSNYLGQVTVSGGIAPGETKMASFLWVDAPAGSYTITARVDINDNETSSPPDPDRINEVDTWFNNQLSYDLTVIPEFQDVLIPVAGTAVIVILFRRKRRRR